MILSVHQLIIIHFESNLSTNYNIIIISKHIKVKSSNVCLCLYLWLND